MGLMRGHDPFDEMNRLFEQMNRVSEGGRPGSAWSPAVDIVETADAVVLYLEVAGVSAREIDIQIVDDTLTIRGTRAPLAGADRRLLRVERPSGAFERSFTLGMPIDQDSVKAAYRDGLLEITLPKQQTQTLRRVKVEVQGGPEIEG